MHSHVQLKACVFALLALSAIESHAQSLPGELLCTVKSSGVYTNTKTGKLEPLPALNNGNGRYRIIFETSKSAVIVDELAPGNSPFSWPIANVSRLAITFRGPEGDGEIDGYIDRSSGSLSLKWRGLGSAAGVFSSTSGSCTKAPERATQF